MFCPLEYRDTMMLVRGLLILIVVIIVGVTVSEKQLNTLTQREDRIPVFTLTADYSGVYSMYILGSSYKMRAVYVVGEIINNNKAIIIKMAEHRFTIPIYLEFDCRKQLIFCESARSILLEEAFKCKKKLQFYSNLIRQKINVYGVQFR